PATADGIAAHLRSLLPAQGEGQNISRLVADLASGSFRTRETAHRALAELGPAARPALVAARNSDDAEVRWRVGRLLAGMHREDDSLLTLAALKLAPLAIRDGADSVRGGPPAPRELGALVVELLPHLQEPFLIAAALETLPRLAPDGPPADGPLAWPALI